MNSENVDNLAIARILAEIGDLLEIKGENPFKIRAYRNASETIAHETLRVDERIDSTQSSAMCGGRPLTIS